MVILGFARKYIPGYRWTQAPNGDESGNCGSGLALLKRLQPFDMELHYADGHCLSEEVEKKYADGITSPSPSAVVFTP
eukprot:6885110-Karenia_brevis.AAC.1